RNSAYCAFVVSYLTIEYSYATEPQSGTKHLVGTGALPGLPMGTHSMVTAGAGAARRAVHPATRSALRTVVSIFGRSGVYREQQHTRAAWRRRRQSRGRRA